MSASGPSCWVASRKRAFAVMSPTPDTRTRGRAGRLTLSDCCPVSATATTRSTDASRAAISGVRPDSDDVRSSSTKKNPNAVPAINGAVSAAGRAARSWASPPSAETRTTATSASRMPAPAQGPIRLPPSRPASTGTAAAVTAVTGAMTLMTPPDRARKKTTSPVAPSRPAPAAQPRSAAVTGPPSQGRRANRATSPASCESATTPNTDARRLARPPRKSDAP